jgi:sulfur relay (sulfurtransferase) DsrC/TusE family protein
MINETIGLDASVLGEMINPKVFGIIRDLKGTKDKKEKILKELEEEQFGGGELFWQPLKDFGLERLKEFCESLPNGIQSGLQKGFKGIYFYYKYDDDYHLWFLYDVSNDSFITNKTEILNFISCKENEPRVIPENIDVFEIHHKVRDEIKRFFSEGLIATQVRTAHGRMEKTLTDMRDELDYIKENYLDIDDPLREKVSDIITNLNNVALTKIRMRHLRKIWKDYKNSKNWHIMISWLEKFLSEKSLNNEQEVIRFDERRLKLICVDFIS